MQWEQACREDQKLKITNQQSHENHFLIYRRGNWSVPKILHQFICSLEQIDLTVDGIVYKLQKSDHFWSLPALLWLATCAKVNGDWSIQQEVDQLFSNILSNYIQIFYQMNWFMLANELIQHFRNTSIAMAVTWERGGLYSNACVAGGGCRRG